MTGRGEDTGNEVELFHVFQDLTTAKPSSLSLVGLIATKKTVAVLER